MPEAPEQLNGLVPPSPEVAVTTTAPAPSGIRQKLLRLTLATVVLVAAGVFGARYYLHARVHEWTNNAFIEGSVIPLSPKVAGQVTKVHIEDNQSVTAGEVLVEIDPRDFAVRLAQARATLAMVVTKQQAAEITVGLTRVSSSADVQQATAEVGAAKASRQTAQAQVAAVAAEATRATADVQRYQQLYEEEVVSRQQLDRAVAAARSATAQLEAARRRVAEAEAQLRKTFARLADAKAAPQRVAVSQSQAATMAAEIEQARATVQQAELELSYTKIVAPEAGRVTRKSVEEGAYVQVGQAIMAVVPQAVWVVANFKETQLTHMRPGQSVTIWVDTYPDVTFRGHLDSIQAGTGARFSLLPPENATGNYVKVVQRVPVKIVFDDTPDPRHPLVPGMSVVPEVKVR